MATEDLSNDSLVPIVYDELRSISRKYLRGEMQATIATTELVHEAYLRLSRGQDKAWNSRAHFFGAAATAMRRILVEHARSKLAKKRGSRPLKVTFSEAITSHQSSPEEGLIDLDRALSRLEAQDAAMTRVVLLRYFGGLSIKEVAELLDVSERTVHRLWTGARAWLHAELQATQSAE